MDEVRVREGVAKRRFDLPESVKVGGKRYSVTQCDVTSRQRVYSGQTQHGCLNIDLDATMHPDRAGEVLWHEVLHCIDDTWDIKLRETQVHRLADGLFQVLTDNPKMRSVYGKQCN